APASGKEMREMPYVPGEILIKYRSSSPKARAAFRTARHLSPGNSGLEKVRIARIRLPETMGVAEALEQYRQDPDVEYAEPNYILHAAATPNDGSFTELWGLNNTGQTGGRPDADIDAPEAWEKTSGSDSVIIAVVDSGVAFDHPDLADNMWVNTGEVPGNGMDDDGNGYIDDIYGWDFIDNDGFPEDLHGHGSHVAGTIAAQGNNGSGITGVLWNAQIMALRFLGITGLGTTADAISAILYAVENGAQAINCSWGGTAFSRALSDAIDSAAVPVVCAAGNRGRDNDGSAVFYPASYKSSNIIAVAATDHNDSLAPFSNFGAESVDLAAPGVSIFSTIPLFSYGVPVTVYSENFNSASGSLPLLGWSRGGIKSSWEVTGGTGVGGTNSLEDSPAAQYLDGTLSWAGAMTPVNSVKNNRYLLRFDWKGELEDGFDYLDINFSLDGLSWDWIDFRTGSTGGSFKQYTADLTPVSDSFDQFYFGFGITADNTVAMEGVFIDNVVLTREPISISAYDYDHVQGTSMAAPHVAGVAGLIMALNPALSTTDIKEAIIKSTDAAGALKGKVLSGGRLNAFKALEYAEGPYAPTQLRYTVRSSSRIDLAWKDNSSREEGFTVERARDGSTQFSVIASLKPDAASYSDRDLSPATRYTYRVRVYGAALGDFAYSDEVSAKTLSSSGGGGGGGGGCFIATAAYGSDMHPHVMALREFRDRHLLQHRAGRAFVHFYYRYSPRAAEIIRDSEVLRSMTRTALYPLVMAAVFPFETVCLVLAALSATVIAVRRRHARCD
ncbi:MAG: S8 family serine peptidase, partial [Nitrospiraceae bacterium]